ncbi:hypothetical protein WS90_16935 [Burkholderia cepacia]|uniref:Uncharacterized protein n=1 Tax=Burkholderia cepacia TaxID=292 RepID=A0A118KHT7_BURCE|nr:hypothetical protein [Burkholderia cepacia]KVK80956.1 hypothetical protein WS90_16935 [Burkholderia cepacia]
MTQIHESAYPVLPALLEEAELRTVYTSGAAEIRLVFGQLRQAPTHVLIFPQLELLQCLGYMPVISDVPPAIIEHPCTLFIPLLGIRPLRANARFIALRMAATGRAEHILNRPGNVGDFESWL